MEAEAQQCPDSGQESVVFIGLHLVKGFWGNTTSQGILIFLCLWVEWIQVPKNGQEASWMPKDTEH